MRAETAFIMYIFVFPGSIKKVFKLNDKFCISEYFTIKRSNWRKADEYKIIVKDQMKKNKFSEHAFGAQSWDYETGSGL